MSTHAVIEEAFAVSDLGTIERRGYTWTLLEQLPVALSDTLAPSIELAPATVEAEIDRNVGLALRTVAGTLPMARGLGLGVSLDAPISRAGALLAADLVTKLPAMEARLDVTAVDASADASGQLVPHVTYRRTP